MKSRIRIALEEAKAAVKKLQDALDTIDGQPDLEQTRERLTTAWRHAALAHDALARLLISPDQVK